MSPLFRVLHAKNAVAFFAKHTRVELSADFAFTASKRTAKTTGISTGRKATDEAKANRLPFRLWMAEGFALSYLEINRVISNDRF